MQNIPPIISSVYSKTYTFTDDTIHRLEDSPDIVLSACNIHITDNDCKYGNASVVSATVKTGAVIWFDGFIRPYDFLFCNNAAGANTTVTIVGTLREG
jgi:hypothetical protein